MHRSVIASANVPLAKEKKINAHAWPFRPPTCPNDER